MSDLTVSTSIGNLTQYNVDGLELWFTTDRKARASQSAIARMCKVSEGTVRNRCSEPTVKNDPKCDVIQAQTSSTGGGKRSQLHNARTIRILLKEFNPDLLEQFEEFGLNEGLAQMAGVPVVVVAPQVSFAEQQRQTAIDAIKWNQLFLASQSNPGDVRQIASAVENHGKLLEGYMTIKEMKEQAGYTMERIQSLHVGQMMTSVVKMRKECGEMKRMAQLPTKDNGYCKNEVNLYPVSMYSNFLSICSALAIS